MEEISNYLTDNQTFNFDFPLENPSVLINYNKTATDDFLSKNIIDIDDNSTIFDNSSINSTYNNINNIYLTIITQKFISIILVMI